MKNPTEHPVHRLFQERWSPRAFEDNAISKEDIASLFEAARWAPSAFNDQPWYFHVASADSREGFQKILGCLMPANQSWAQHAPLLGIAIARTTFAHNGTLNRHAGYDTGQAVAAISYQAVALGLAMHQMAGFSIEAVRKGFSLPDKHEPMVAFAIGHAGDPSALPEHLQKRETAPRERRDLEQTVFGPESST